MIRALSRNLNDDQLEKSSRWAANAVVNGVSQKIPLFKEHLSNGFKNNHELLPSVKSYIISKEKTKFDEMLDYYDTSTDEVFTFYVDKVDDKYIFNQVDVGICYHLGIRLSQMNDMEINPTNVFCMYDKKWECVTRAFKGESVEYVGKSFHSDYFYRVQLFPEIERGTGNVTRLRCLVTFDMQEYEEPVDQSKLKVISIGSRIQRNSTAFLGLIVAAMFYHYLGIIHDFSSMYWKFFDMGIF